MIKEKSFAKKITRAIAIVAIVIASFSTINISAQSSETGSDDYALELAYSDQSCYTAEILDCGFHFGTQRVCLFNGVYGKPFTCEEYGCYGSRSHRTCQRIYY